VLISSYLRPIVLALASVSSTMSVNVAGYLRRNYDSTASVAISDAEEPKQAGRYEPTSVFAEKKKVEVDKAQEKLWRWTEIEACEECRLFKEQIENATSELGKKKAKKYFYRAAAAAFRAASHESDQGKAAWEQFQERYGAEKAEKWADEWLAKHASSYDEKAFDDIDFAAAKGPIKVEQPPTYVTCAYPGLDETLN
jgi:predicted ATPase